MCGVQLKGPLDMYGSAKGPLDMYGSVGGPLGQWTCMVQLEGPLDMYGSVGGPLGHVWFSWRAPWTCMVQLKYPLDMCGSVGGPLGHVWFSWRAPWICVICSSHYIRHSISLAPFRPSFAGSAASAGAALGLGGVRTGELPSDPREFPATPPLFRYLASKLT